MGDTVERKKRDKAAVTAAIMEEEEESSSEVIRWDKFLPRMVLSVLLVEADDSTRQVISALLRKCNYKVAAMSDGLMAWETLKGRPHNIDLILTEVELPSISGYALLTLVMDHDICKNIPVIMMSSQDSINMVLKCMLKGAADFLIKPVRRNELKNLWQHVWRRRTLNVGQVPQSSPIVHHQIEATSENNGFSTYSTDCATSPRKDEEFDKNRSNTESSCTTPYLEAESGQMQNLQVLLEPKHGRASIESNILTEKYEELEKLDNESDKPKSEIGGLSNDWDVKDEDPSCNPTALTMGKDCPSLKTLVQNEKIRPENDGEHPHYRSDQPVESSRRAMDLIGTFDNSAERLYGFTELKDGTSKFEFSPKLDLCLSNSGRQVAAERHKLNHSDGSAFSWYNSTKLRALSPMSSSNHVKEDDCKFAEPCLNNFSPNVNQKEISASMIEKRKVMTTTIIGQQGKCDLAYPAPQIQLFPFPGVTLEKVSAGCGHAVPPVYYPHSGLSPSWGPKLSSLREQSPLPTSASVHSNHETHGSEQNYRQSDETSVNSVDQHKHSENLTKPEQEVRHDSSAGAQSTSSRCNGVPNCNSSIAHGSSLTRHDGCSLPATVEKVMAPDAMKDSSQLGNDGIIGTSVHRSTHREAALTKFRMKRKERCYGKKVRYQSRKRLAEQRPRVKGQFIRQVQNDTLPNANG